MRKHSPKLKESSTALAAVLVLSYPLSALAQAGAMDQQGGTIDIQANEQEFMEDHVVAKGNVHVIYKDSIIDAPMATLYKDAAGKPQRAIFTGHPRLKQGQNIIHADTLTFEMASSIIIADGNAHSEVIPKDGSNATKTSKKLEGKTAAKKETTDPAEGSEVAEGSENTVSEDARKAAALPVKDKSQPVKQDKMITDSDHQVYNRETGQFDARGNVRLRTGDIFVKSDTLRLVYDAEQKPETALFTGHVKATQNTDCTEADLMTYFLTTKRLQATGHVKSTVVQTKQAEATKKGGPYAASKAGTTEQPVKSAGTAIAKAGSNETTAEASGENSDTAPIAQGEKGTETASDDAQKEPIYIFSDAQDYSENTGRYTADGNVKLFHQETIGVAPKMIMIKNLETGQTEKVLLLGRCQITQPGKRWIADRITYTLSDDKVVAEGNTKAFILQQKPTGAPASGGTQLAQRKNNMSITVPRSTIAYKTPNRASGNEKLSASKVETPK